MPELPEVETVCRGMERALKGRVIAAIDVRRKNLRVPFPVNLASALQGATIENLSRRAKYILMHAGNRKVMILHLGMSGRVLLVPANQDYAPQKHDHLILTFDDSSRMVFNDARRFGMVLLADEKELSSHSVFKNLGPEPLGNGFSGAALFDSLRGKKTSIKAALMDQRTVAGLGNIYVSEALFHAGINPSRIAAAVTAAESEKLARAIHEVLEKAIAAGGSTLKDYRHADGELGYFQHHFAVYDREGGACPGCRCDINKTKGIVKIVQAGRSTYYCPARQE